MGQAAGNREEQSGLLVESSGPRKAPEWPLEEPELHVGDWFQTSVSGYKRDCD